MVQDFRIGDAFGPKVGILMGKDWIFIKISNSSSVRRKKNNRVLEVAWFLDTIWLLVSASKSNEDGGRRDRSWQLHWSGVARGHEEFEAGEASSAYFEDKALHEQRQARRGLDWTSNVPCLLFPTVAFANFLYLKVCYSQDFWFAFVKELEISGVSLKSSVDGRPEFSPVFRSGSCAEIGPKQNMEDEHICIDDLVDHLGSPPNLPSPGAFYGVREQL